MDNKKIGMDLKLELKKGYDIVRISRWAYSVLFDNIRELNSVQEGVLEELSRMEDDPQFEYKENELFFLAELLIKNEDNVIFKTIEKFRKTNN